MAKKKSYYMPLDEDFLSDPEVQIFLEEKGKEAVFDYLMILLKMRNFEDYDFMIPFSYIPLLRREINTTTESINKTINYCIGNGFFKVYKDVLGDEFFYSERRQNDLRNWKLSTEKMSEAGKRGNAKRWNKGEITDEEQK